MGALPTIPSAPLFSPRLDVQVDGGPGYVAFFAAVRFNTLVYRRARAATFAPTIEAGARWHVTARITVGLAIAVGVSVFVGPEGGSGFLVGATIEPFTFSVTRSHEVGVVITGLIPIGTPPGPVFEALVLPGVGYTFRF